MSSVGIDGRTCRLRLVHAHRVDRRVFSADAVGEVAIGGYGRAHIQLHVADRAPIAWIVATDSSGGRFGTLHGEGIASDYPLVSLIVAKFGLALGGEIWIPHPVIDPDEILSRELDPFKSVSVDFLRYAIACARVIGSEEPDAFE